MGLLAAVPWISYEVEVYTHWAVGSDIVIQWATDTRF